MTIPFVEDRGELLRWTLSGVAIVFFHGAVAAAMINWGDDDVAEPTAAMVVDLAPYPMAPPESVTELPPGPEQVEAEAAPQTPVSEVKEEVEERVETQESQEEVQQELTPVENPEVALAALPPKPQQQVEVPQVNQMPAPETTAPPPMPEVAPGEVAAAEVQGPPNIDRSNAIPTWRSSVAALLERNKRYPADAKNDRGIAQVAFSIDRRGRVMSSRVVKTSGSAALDRAAIDMVRRAQPFPPPPTALPGVEVSLTVPVRFNMR
ncbi:MAG: TonB family protein [Rhizobiales bacterium]|nr:TonB family protein [Hyphomicrobiales bacterium]